jgi:hypothetical protein
MRLVPTWAQCYRFFVSAVPFPQQSHAKEIIMRSLFSNLVFIFLLALEPVASHAAEQMSGTDFGGVTCPQKLPCPDQTSVSYSDLAMNATMCVAAYLGSRSRDGFFRETGMDGNGCLTNKPNAVSPSGNSITVLPKCCLRKLPDNSCAFHCDMIGQ